MPKPLGQVFIWIFLEEGLSGIYMSFAFCDNTYLYVSFHYETTIHDENMNKPILERRMMGETCEIEIFSKSGYLLGPESKISPNLNIFKDFYQF